MSQEAHAREAVVAGDPVVTQGRTVTEADLLTYAGFTGDFAPLHTDETYAAATPFRTRILHGPATFALLAGLAARTRHFERGLAFLGASFTLQRPVVPGDTLRARVRESSLRRTSDGAREIATLEIVGLNQHGDTVAQIEWKQMRSCPDTR